MTSLAEQKQRLGKAQARRHGFRAGGARKIWRALSLFFDDYGAL